MIPRLARSIAALAALTGSTIVHAQVGAVNAAAAGDTAVSGALDRAFGQLSGAGGEPLSLSLQLLLVMGLLTILPALLLMMTGFTRIIIVLSLLRSAIGTPTAPPNRSCSFRTSTDLCILPCARWRMPWARA